MSRRLYQWLNEKTYSPLEAVADDIRELLEEAGAMSGTRLVCLDTTGKIVAQSRIPGQKPNSNTALYYEGFPRLVAALREEEGKPVKVLRRTDIYGKNWLVSAVMVQGYLLGWLALLVTENAEHGGAANDRLSAEIIKTVLMSYTFCIGEKISAHSEKLKLMQEKENLHCLATKLEEERKKLYHNFVQMTMYRQDPKRVERSIMAVYASAVMEKDTGKEQHYRQLMQLYRYYKRKRGKDLTIREEMTFLENFRECFSFVSGKKIRIRTCYSAESAEVSVPAFAVFDVLTILIEGSSCAAWDWEFEAESCCENGKCSLWIIWRPGNENAGFDEFSARLRFFHNQKEFHISGLNRDPLENVLKNWEKSSKTGFSITVSEEKRFALKLLASWYPAGLEKTEKTTKEFGRTLDQKDKKDGV